PFTSSVHEKARRRRLVYRGGPPGRTADSASRRDRDTPSATRLSALGRFVDRRCTTANRGADQGALTAAHDRAHTCTGGGGSADDHRGLLPGALLRRILAVDDITLTLNRRCRAARRA